MDYVVPFDMKQNLLLLLLCHFQMLFLMPFRLVMHDHCVGAENVLTQYNSFQDLKKRIQLQLLAVLRHGL